MTTAPHHPNHSEEEHNDFIVLGLADERRIFRAPVAHPPIHIGRIMARIIDARFLELVDIEPAPVEGHIMRVFRLTDSGLARFEELKKKVEQ